MPGLEPICWPPRDLPVAARAGLVTWQERAILRIAASLSDPEIPVRLRTVPGNLDTRNITLVADAITAANG